MEKPSRGLVNEAGLLADAHVEYAGILPPQIVL